MKNLEGKINFCYLVEPREKYNNRTIKLLVKNEIQMIQLALPKFDQLNGFEIRTRALSIHNNADNIYVYIYRV